MTPPRSITLGNPFGVSLFPTDFALAPLNGPPPGETTVRAVDSFERLGVTFSTRTATGTPIPPGPAMTLQQARALTETRIAGMSPVERAETVAAIARSIARDRTAAEPLQREALRVLRGALDEESLSETFEQLIDTRELGFVVDHVGLTELIALCNYGTYGLDFNAIAARSDTVRERGMTLQEREYTARIFGNGIDYDAVRFRFTSGTMTSGAEALVLGNTVHIDPATPRFTFLPGTTMPDERGMREWLNVVLAHELTHVWQYQHIGSGYALQSITQQIDSIIRTGDRGAPYEYDLSAHRNFSEFGIEQQAMIVQDYDNLLVQVEAGERPRSALARFQPFIDELRAAGPGMSTPFLSPEQLAALPPDSPFRNAFGADGVMQGAAALFPGLARQIGSEAFDGLLRGDPGSALIVAAIVGLSYNRGSQILEEYGLPNTVRFGDRHFGVSLGARYGARFADPAAIVGFDANGTVGGMRVRGAFSTTIGERVSGEISGTSRDVSFNLGARFDPTGFSSAFRLASHGFFADGSLRLSPDWTVDRFDARAGYASSRLGVSASLRGDSSGLTSLRLSGNAVLGDSAIAGNVHLDGDGSFDSASLAVSRAISREVSLEGASSFGREGVRSVSGGVSVRGRAGSLGARLRYAPVDEEAAAEVTAESGSLRAFARGALSPTANTLTFGLSGRF